MSLLRLRFAWLFLGSGCLYPSYTFDLEAGGSMGGGGKNEPAGTAGSTSAGGMVSGGQSGTNGIVGGSGGSRSDGGSSQGGSSGQGGSLPAIPSYCPAPADPKTLVLHAQRGDDTTGDGSCDKPLRTFKEALKRAAAVGSTATTLRVLGNAAGAAPLVYSTASGEVFPIALAQGFLVVEGDGADRVLLQGNGDCGGGETCTLKVSQPRVEVRGVSITGLGSGVVALNDAKNFTLAQCIVSLCGLYGLQVYNYASANVLDTVLERNKNDGVSGNNSEITLRRVQVRQNGGNGVHTYGSSIDSSDSFFSNNQESGIKVEASSVTSERDTYTQNVLWGLEVANYGSGNLLLKTIRSTKNGAGGVFFLGTSAIIRNSQFLENFESGVVVGDSDAPSLTVDLGTSSDPGNNVLQTFTNSNKQGGLRNNNTKTVVNAWGNQWAHCPTPKANPDRSCTQDVDLCGLGSTNVGDVCQLAP